MLLTRRKALSLTAGTAGLALAAPGILHAQSGPIRIGGLLPLSGPAAIEGSHVLHGLEFAVKEANEAGGVNGREIELVLEDDQGNVSQGVIAARRLVERDNVPFIVGSYASAVVIGLMPVIKELGIPLLSAGATSAAATDANEAGNPLFFRAWPSGTGQGSDTAIAITERFGARRVAIMHDITSYGTSLADQVQGIVEERGVEVIARESYNVGEQDFSTILFRLRGQNPDVLYIGGWAADGAMIVRQAAEFGLSTQIIGSGSMVSDDFIELAGPASEGFAVASLYEPGTPNEFGAAFGRRFQAANGESAGTLSALGFDSTNIGIEAMRRTGGTDRAAIRSMIATGMKDFPITLGPAGQTASFNETGGVDFHLFITTVRNGVRTIS